MQDVIKRSCEPFRTLLQALPEVERRNAREIRIRAGQPVRVLGLSDTALGAQGRPFCPSEAQVAELLRAFCGQSPYAFEEQMANGYLTLPGGHRVGLCGHAVLREGKLARLSKVQGMNIRIARQVPAAGAVLSFLMNGGRVRNTLAVSPPGMGKTTLLRHLALLLSDRGFQVALVDERGELAAMQGGLPQLKVGARTDVMEGCPKAQAIPLLIRAMAPDVLVTDEIGGQGDCVALEEAARCGVAVIASAHGSSIQDLYLRPKLREILEQGVFERFVVLGQSPGHVCGVYDGEGRLCRCAC